jgi:hypothetical protein
LPGCRGLNAWCSNKSIERFNNLKYEEICFAITGYNRSVKNSIG